MNYKNEIKAFNNCLEYHKPKKEGNEKEKNGYYSFKLEAMKDTSNLYEYYRILADAIYSIEASQDIIYAETAYYLDYIANNTDSLEDLNNLDILEVASEPNPYTSILTAWLAENINHIYYLTNAIEKYQAKDGFQALITAQSLCIQEIWLTIHAAVLDYLNEKD